MDVTTPDKCSLESLGESGIAAARHCRLVSSGEGDVPKKHGAAAPATPCVSAPSGLNVDHHLEVAGVVPQVAVVDAQV